MEVEYDEAKSKHCLRMRGFDFAHAVSVFEDPHSVNFESTKYNFGEARYVTIGMIDEILYTVIWTPRGNKRRIISARKTKKKERSIYGTHH